MGFCIKIDPSQTPLKIFKESSLQQFEGPVTRTQSAANVNSYQMDSGRDKLSIGIYF